MHKLLLTILATSISIYSYSQNWVNSAGGNFNDEAYDVEVDASGNIYTTGYTTAASVFGPSINLTTNGYSDIFVSKSDANGNFLWTKVFGGPQVDRGYDIELDATGNIYVTGTFMGTATFGSFTITSNNNSQDIFVMKLDNTGNVLWINAEGGSGGDTGYGITVDNNGDIIATGQFIQTAQIGSNTFSSTIDPNTNQPAYDMFIAKYDGSGNDLWSMQGVAKYDDRGLALKTDVNNDIYVTGQFSDTLTIAANTHNNTIFNAGMVLKLDAAGNHIWFKRIGAIQTLVYDIEIDNQNDVYITGDFQGQMMIIGNPINYFLNGNYTYRVFLIKMDSSGDVLWMEEDDSDSEVSSKAICLDANDDPYITGIFKCVFDEYADTLGGGLFNSVGFNDVFITKYDKTGNRQWMRQYGGPLDDYCSGIAITQTNNPIIAGGYTEYFNYPLGLNFTDFTGINNFFPGYSWSTTCNVSAYKYLNAVGAKDIFVGKLVDLTLPHYYYYENTSCYDKIDPCINNTCPDSVAFCSKGILFDNTHTVGNGTYYPNYNANPTNPHHAPYYDFLWNNNDTTDTTHINLTGQYSVFTERIDGCFSNYDTIHVTINPLPNMPHLTDDYGFNNQTYPLYNDIHLCYPDTPTTWFGDLDTNLLFTYTTPNTTYNDSLPHQIYAPGNYSVNVIDSNGCNNSDVFKLIYDYVVQDTIVPYLLLSKDTICYDESVCLIVGDSLTNPNGNFIPYCDSSLVSQGWNIYGSTCYADSCLSKSFKPSVSGWYSISVNFVLGYNNLCGIDTTHYTVQDSFYITVLPKPTVSFNLNGDSLLCPGDTVNVWTDNVINGFNWNGPSILTINSFGDTIFANQQGLYSYGGTITDSITGCSNTINKSFNVNVKPSPTIVSNVPDNIICPGDSIQLTCLESGVQYDWYGPLGPLNINSQSIWVTTPGFYHCVLTDFDGCILTSNTIELKEYNTPYILVDPGTELCHVGNITLTAIYNGAPSINWLPPINSTSPSVIVNQPDTYYVEVTQCGITVRDSVIITHSNITANITLLSDSIICPGDTAILMANSGMGGYEWHPVQFYGQILQTTDTGDYYVTVTDAQTGCTANSDTVNISFHPGGSLPNLNNQTICYGDTTTLVNLNTGITTNWFVDSLTSTPFATADSITLNGLTNDTIIYVENLDSNCTSDRIAVNINISPASATPIINGNNIVCYGDTLQLSTPTIPNGNYNWSGPNNFSSNQNPVTIINTDSTNAGTYTLSVSDGNCSSGDTNIVIAILPPPNITINMPDTIKKCLIDTIIISANGNYQNIIWNTGSTLDSTLAFLPGYYYATVTDSNGCISISDSIYVGNYIVAQPQLSDTSVCYGDSILLSTFNNQILNWYDSSLTIIAVDSTYQTPALYSNTQYAVTYTDSNGCESIATIVNITVIPANGTPNIFGDTALCEGETLNLSTNPITGANYLWSNNNNPNLGNNTNYTNPSVTVNDSGYYYLNVTGINCINAQASIYVTVHPQPSAPTILGDTAYCSSDTTNLYTLSNYDSLIWVDPNFNYYISQDSLSITPIYTGYYYLSGIDSNGCYSAVDSILISTLPSPPMPNIYANTSLCAGDSLLLATDTLQNITYLWQGPNNYSNTVIVDTLNNVSPINSGNYYLTITDTNGCSTTNQTNITINNYPTLNLGNDTVVCIDSLAGFSFNLDTNYTSIIWHNNSNSTSFPVLDSGLYYVTVAYGNCSVTDSIYVTLDSCTISMVANVFTPNGDGFNDYFVIEGIEHYPNSKLEVFNRWGDSVFEDHNYQNNWDGGNLKTGTYYYLFYPNDPTGKARVKKGFITLIR